MGDMLLYSFVYRVGEHTVRIFLKRDTSIIGLRFAQGPFFLVFCMLVFLFKVLFLFMVRKSRIAVYVFSLPVCILLQITAMVYRIFNVFHLH